MQPAMTKSSSKKQNKKHEKWLQKQAKQQAKLAKRVPMTSKTHPLRIDWLSPSYTDNCSSATLLLNTKNNTKFHLGMTLCPGRQSKHSRSGVWHRDLDLDLQAIKNNDKNRNIDIIVSILTTREMANLNVSNLRQRIEYYGMKSLYIWQPDNLPKDEQVWMQFVKNVANDIENTRVAKSKTTSLDLRLSSGNVSTNEKKDEKWEDELQADIDNCGYIPSIIVHCKAGRNRTGMFVLSLLKYLNVIDSSNVKIGHDWIAKCRDGAGGTQRQVDFVTKLDFDNINNYNSKSADIDHGSNVTNWHPVYTF